MSPPAMARNDSAPLARAFMAGSGYHIALACVFARTASAARVPVICVVITPRAPPNGPNRWQVGRVRTKTRKPAVFQPRMSKIVAVDFRYAIVVTDRCIITTGEIDSTPVPAR